MESITLNRVYEFHCPASFGSLPQEKIDHLFKDGRKASGFLEVQLEEWFPSLKFEDGRGYDYRDEEGNLYDAKCFTRRGCKFCPSVMIGAGRRVDEDALWEHAEKMIYILCDIIEFPRVRVVFKAGSDMRKYKKGFIPVQCRDDLFGRLPEWSVKKKENTHDSTYVKQ